MPKRIAVVTDLEGDEALYVDGAFVECETTIYACDIAEHSVNAEGEAIAVHFQHHAIESEFPYPLPVLLDEVLSLDGEG